MGQLNISALSVAGIKKFWSETSSQVSKLFWRKEIFYENVLAEVRAICRFWGFDGNGLLGHRLIDSRWFEENSPTESGWKRRSKKNAHAPVFRAETLVTQYVLSSSRHLVTPLIYIHFCVWLGLFVDRWWLKKVWYAPDFLSNCSTCVPIAAPRITRSPSKRICRGTLLQNTRNWSIWQAAHGYVSSEGPACARFCCGQLACTFSLRTNASSSVPSLHFFSKHLFVVFLGSEIVEIDAGSASQCPERPSMQAEQSAPRSKRRQAMGTGTRTWKIILQMLQRVNT